MANLRESFLKKLATSLDIKKLVKETCDSLNLKKSLKTLQLTLLNDFQDSKKTKLRARQLLDDNIKIVIYLSRQNINRVLK